MADNEISGREAALFAGDPSWFLCRASSCQGGPRMVHVARVSEPEQSEAQGAISDINAVINVLHELSGA